MTTDDQCCSRIPSSSAAARGTSPGRGPGAGCGLAADTSGSFPASRSPCTPTPTQAAEHRAGAAPLLRDRSPSPGPPRSRPAARPGADGDPRRATLQRACITRCLRSSSRVSPPPASWHRSGSSPVSSGSRTSWSTSPSATASEPPTDGVASGGRRDELDDLRRAGRRRRGGRAQRGPRPGPRPSTSRRGRRRVAPERSGRAHAGLPVTGRDATGRPAGRSVGPRSAATASR